MRDEPMICIKIGTEDMVSSNRNSTRTCPECAAVYPDQEAKVAACPSCGAKPAIGTGTGQPLRTVWGAPFRK